MNEWTWILNYGDAQVEANGNKRRMVYDGKVFLEWEME